MFGSATAAGNKNPRVKMTHISALVAIKVVNEGAGLPITIKDVEFSIPDMYDSKGKLIAGKEALPIVGDCEVTFLNKSSVSVDKSSATGAKYSHSTKVTLAEDVTLDEPGDSVTFYMAIRPLSFAANEREISIRVNGSERKIKNKEAIQFKSGSVTTIKVPVKSLTGSQITDALPTGEGESKVSPFTSVADRDDSKTYDVLTVSGTKIEGGLIINGKQVEDVYQIGSAGGGIGKIKIEGYAKDMINALPISFNVSSMDNEPAAMTIESIDALIPQYRSSYGSIIFGVNEMNFKSGKVYRKRMNQHGMLGSTLGSFAVAILSGIGVKLSDGLSRKELINFADPNVITFNNLPTNGYFSKGNVVVLDEANTNKNLSYDTIDYFLGEKFSYGGNTATYKGLYAILNAEYSEETGWKFEYPSYSEVADKGKVLTNLDDNPNNDMEEYALQTANGMYNKVKASLDARSLGDLFPIVVESSEHLMHLLRETKLEINISNYPYKKDYPEDEHLETGYKPIILWGLNATLPGER